MDWRVPLADLDFGVEEEQAVLQVLRSRWLTMGGVTQEFERQFALAHGVKHALALSRRHCGASPGLPGGGGEAADDRASLSFVATANAVLPVLLCACRYSGG
jgi:dTDP-4-amino-4,6-dideoxygalactose transaminase